MKHKPTYITWRSMMNRCFYVKNDNYKYYGGRGITVCERWQTYEYFLEDMGERPDGMTIDRINTEGHYEPGNCRWATRSEQRKSQRERGKISPHQEIKRKMPKDKHSVQKNSLDFLLQQMHH